MGEPLHPVFAAVAPLLEAVGGAPVSPEQIQPGDIPLEWDGEVVGAVRVMSLDGALERMVAQIESELGSSLADLDRDGKQLAVRMLDERGAFHLRRSIDEVADTMGVSRITIYNYLNAIRQSAEAR